ncbi:hypothetical protein E1B28_011468 [Marasmius oreades]|uniref:Uncharacterized protein n=1 Tax=Marasmius oreades TaxID=181124 RepID=A0A9P7RUB3_9AGAR|nr:uncharacterized protein E1B28_011468 [Marasmius oreades]KAG7089820.1 hypothetical protein E1B28_011468 [Marasmius oreades]
MQIQHRNVRPQASNWTYANAVGAVTAPSTSPPPAIEDQNQRLWEVHPFCGLLHTPESNCAICSSLILHIRDAKRMADENSLAKEEAKSFADALAALHRQNDVSYWEGVERGRLEARREEAKKISPPPPEYDREEAHSEVREGQQQKQTQLSTNEKASLHCNNAKKEPPAPSSRGQSVVRVAVKLPNRPQVKSQSDRKDRVPQDYYSMFRSPSVETYLRQTMDKAQAGDVFALNHIRALAREAHSTPRDNKSFGQRFVLTEWRNPASDDTRRTTNQSEGSALPNPRLDDPIEDWFTYYCVHGSSLPRGVRRDVNGNPYLPDLKASRMYALLRPASLATPTSAKTEFTVHSMELIVTESLYESILSRLSIPVASELHLRAYDGPVKITVEEVARHFARCGLSVEMVNRDLVSWAKEYQSPK